MAINLGLFTGIRKIIDLLLKSLLWFSLQEKWKCIVLYLSCRQFRRVLCVFLSFTMDHALVHINTVAVFTQTCVCFALKLFWFNTFYFLSQEDVPIVVMFLKSIVLPLCCALKNRICLPLSFRVANAASLMEELLNRSYWKNTQGSSIYLDILDAFRFLKYY